ncbi:MAG: pyruvate kinase [Candidatus Thiodiazotropha sp.]
MIHPANKVKIIGTIGPASDSEATMKQLLLSGMNIARLNFSHGDFDTHQANILKLRRAAEKTGKRLASSAPSDQHPILKPPCSNCCCPE